MKAPAVEVSKTVAAIAVLLLLVAVASNQRHSEGSSSLRRQLFLIDPKTSTEKTSKDTQMLACLQTILLENQLPIGPGPKDDGQLKVFAHHWDARNPQWNVNLRMAPIPQIKQLSSCSVWEVGANTRAQDTQMFLKQYPQCVYHAYEPIPDYYKQLELNWSAEDRVTPHAYGLGPEDYTFQVAASKLQGESTYIGDAISSNNNNEEGTTVTAHIKSFANAVADAGGQTPTLLHINCEGCEWEMLPAAKRAGFLDTIEVIQFGTHNYGQVGLGGRTWQLCEIRQMLSETHDTMAGDVAFGWERWVKRHN